MGIAGNQSNVLSTGAAAPPQAPPEPPAEGYVPGDFTVDEVKAYVEAHPDERESILRAEQEGKGRVTLIDWLTSYGSG